MNQNDIVRVSLSYVFERSTLFGRVQAEIDTFLEKDYAAAGWLSLNQAYTIHEILLSGDKDTVIERLDKYKELQLKRVSEKDGWQKVVSGKKAIDHFYEMIEGLLNQYLPQITTRFEEKFGLRIDKSHHPMIYQNLIRTFDYIFITRLRILKGG